MDGKARQGERVGTSESTAPTNPYSKSLSPPEASERLREFPASPRLRRRRCVDVNVGLGFRLGRRRRRFLDDRRIGFLFLGRRIRYRRFLLLASGQQRGPH
jgi:hypothetical protein